MGVEGSTPLGGAWSFDWLAGAAVLVGGRELKVTASTPNPPISVTQNFSDNAAILNLDAQDGLSYWVNPNLKVTASYRFDGYFKALITFNSVGNVVNVDRFYNGPMVRLTSTW